MRPSVRTRSTATGSRWAGATGSAAADFGDQGHLAYRRTIYRRTDRLTAGGRWIRTIGPRHERADFCCGRRIAGPNGGSQKGLFLIRYRWFESISLQRRVGSKLGSDLRALLNQGEATDQAVRQHFRNVIIETNPAHAPFGVLAGSAGRSFNAEPAGLAGCGLVPAR